MFGQKKGEKQLKPILGSYLGGIPGVDKNFYFEASLNEDETSLKMRVGQKEVNLPISKIQAVEIGTETEILEKSKSVIGRGAVGALFGPVGAIIGAVSGTGTKKKEKKKNLLVISYMGNNKIENITVDLGGEGSLSIGAARKVKERIDKEIYGDGPIQL